MPAVSVEGPFLLDDLNRPFAEGRSATPDGFEQRPRLPLWLLLLLGPWLWIGVLQAVEVLHSVTIRMHLAEDGQAGRGVVLDRIKRSDDEGSTYEVVYRFAPPGWPQAPLRADISVQTYSGLSVGGELDVVYSPSHPGSVLLAANNTWNPVIGHGLFALFWNGSLWFVIFAMLSAAVRRIAITRWSRPCRGTLKAIAVKVDDEGNRTLQLDYTFTTSDGRVLTGRWAGACSVPDDDLPVPGRQLVVAHAARWGHELL